MMDRWNLFLRSTLKMGEIICKISSSEEIFSKFAANNSWIFPSLSIIIEEIVSNIASNGHFLIVV